MITKMMGAPAPQQPGEEEQYYRQQLERIEGYVFLTALLIILLVVFGSFRRRSHNSVFKYLIWAVYVLSVSLVTYTMGQIQSSSLKYDVFVLWATFLLIFLGSADSISSFSLEDHENWKRENLEDLVQYFWLLFLVIYSAGDDYTVPLILLCALSFFRLVGRREALKLVSRTQGLVSDSKVLADFMAHEHELSNEEEVDPTCMKGYNYLVSGEDEKKMKVSPPLYEKRLDIADHQVITIEKIWQCEGRLLRSTGDPKGRLKDLCLSYALYRLLRRRFAEYSFSEGPRPKTWKFARYGLLSKEGDHERAFRVIEVELAFLYDFFYTKYPCFFVGGGLPLILRTIEFAVLITSCCLLLKTLDQISAPQPIYGSLGQRFEISGHSFDEVATCIIIVFILFIEAVQYYVVIFSDWAKVHLLCYYAKKPKWQKNKCIEKIVQIVCHKKWLKPWERKLGQYCLLESFNYDPCILVYNVVSSQLIDLPRKGQKESARIKLPVEVKKAIIRSLKTNGQRLSNGITSLQRYGVENKLSWACRLETQTHVILVWHIATSLFEIAPSQPNSTIEQAKTSKESEDFIVATKLSKYCAHLVAFTPRLLPDHDYTTEFIFDQVVQEARDVLKGFKSLTSRHEEMMKLGEGDRGETIIKRGAVLAKHLADEIQDNKRRWEILADFWAEMMLFVAPSDDVYAHAENLANGGEFVTHLWALLSHAGILNRDSDQDIVDV